MTIQSRTVRVFLSSTFRDFAEERDLLVRKVFPELRRKCRERQVELVDVDLRWGITEEEAQQGKVLPICLAEIDRSRPFFMGFIGDRYGWVPEKGQYDLSLIMEQSWLDEHRGGKSVTELEMLHGVLNNPAMEDRAFFYFRDSAYSQAKGGAYLSEGPQEKAKLEALKDRIRQSGFPVVENYRSPEELAEHVRDDLWKLIDEAFPESEVPDALARERMRHEAFTASRLGLYIGGEHYFDQIDSAMLAETRRPVLVTGDSGGGKSALLANWASRFSQHNPRAILLTHCLATGVDAAQPVNMAVRILREISRIIGEELMLEGDPRKALHMLAPWLAKAGAFAAQKGGLFVLVLDGLDKMDAHDMGWWPSKLPDGVGLAASCLSGKVFDAISSRMDWEKLPVSPLQREDCETFIASHLGKYRKSLTPAFTCKVLDHHLSGNPLFLRTLLEELRVFGVHEELGPKLDHYLSSLTVDDLFERVLERVESDNSPESVRAVLEVLWAAKESFAEDELLAVSGLPPAVWAPIHIALDESLIGAGGRLAFSHDYLRKAVEDRYLPSAEDRRRIQNRMAEFCAQAMAGGRKDISHYVRRHAIEHFLEVEDWDNATAALSDLEFIEARAIAQELPAMLTDYAEAAKLLPDGEKERQTEAARQAELDRYAGEMYEYASTWTRIRGGSSEPEPTSPRPVESIRLWTEEEIAAERKRMTDSPNRLDIIKAFRVFVATNFTPLHQYSTQKGFAANLARNNAPEGPVHEEGKRRLQPLKCIKLIKQFAPHEKWNPLPACKAILQGHKNGVYSVALSADLRLAVSGSWDNTIRIWDMQSWDCLKILQGHTDRVRSIAINCDGRIVVSGSEDNSVRIWDIETGKCLKVMDGHKGHVNTVDLTHNGKFVASGGWFDKTIRIWDVQSGECLKVLRGHEGHVHAVRLSRDLKIVVSASGASDEECSNYKDNTVRIWDARSGECLKILHGHEKAVNSLAISADGGFIVSGSSDKTVRIWDAMSGECLRVLKDHDRVVTSVAVSDDGKLVFSGSKDLRVWDVYSGKCVMILNGHENIVNAVATSADGHCIATGSGWDRTLRIWDIGNGRRDDFLRIHKSNIRSVSISNNGSLAITGSADKSIGVWNCETRECIKLLCGHESGVESVVLSADGRRAFTGGADRTVRIWDTEIGTCLHTLEGHESGVYSLALSFEGQHIISGDVGQSIRIWDAGSGQCINKLTCNTMKVLSLAVSFSGSIVSGDGDKALRIWNSESGKCERVLTGHKGWINSTTVSGEGLSIISGGGVQDKTVHVWDMQNGACLNILKGHEGPIVFVGLSADGGFIVSASPDATVRIWDKDTGECLGIFFQRGLSCAQFQSQAGRLVTGFSDGRVEFYNIENLSLGPFLTTAHCLLISEDLPPGPLTARPPCCGQLIPIPVTIADCIKHWAMEGGEGGYTDPALLMDCPSCGTPLRMNPFFVNL